MKLLITSGGTSEAIDRVRSITNHATGRLGTELATTFLEAGHEVSLVTTHQAIQPSAHPNLTTYYIKNVADLAATLEVLVKEHDAIIHAMAVSDYTPTYMTGLSELLDTPDITNLLDKSTSAAKVSSQEEVQVLFLKKTPKLISNIKQWNPAIRLIGFKLLVAVSPEELVSVARESLIRNQADLIVANDLTEIAADQHIAYLVDENTETKVTSKKELAEALLARLGGRIYG